MAIDVNTGKERLFFTTNSALLSVLAWMPDGSGVLLLSQEIAPNAPKQIIFVSHPEGKLRPVTRDTNSYDDLSLAADGHTLATVLSESHAALDVAAGDGASPRQLLSSPGGMVVNWTPSGQLLIDQDVRISLLNPDSGARTALTPDGQLSIQPAACPDGRYVVLSKFEEARRALNVWRIDANGANPKQLSSGKNDEYSKCSSDGAVFFSDIASGGRLNRVPMDGGNSAKISDLIVAGSIDLSPDGKLLAFYTFHSNDAKGKLALLSAPTGATEKLLDLERPPHGPLRFSHDGKALVYPIHTGEVHNLWRQNLDGSPGQQITHFDCEEIWDFRWSPDGSKLALVRGHTDSDVVLIRDSQQ